MPLPNVSIANIKRYATDKSFSRGDSYYRAGAVTGVTLREQILYADVEGNSVEPYRVTVTFDGGGVTKAQCACPYSFGGWCKHIVATLLVCVHKPKSIEERPPLSQLLAPLSLAQANELIQFLVTEKPALIESVDFYVGKLAQSQVMPAQSKQTKQRSKRKTSVDPAPYQRRVREILREAVRGWEYGQDDDSIAFDLEALLQDALAFLEKGDGPNALVLLKGITQGCANSWNIVDDFLGLPPNEFGIDFDSAWTAALLSTDLTAEEILDWQVEIENWQESLGSFSMALTALNQGWDYPPLLKVFQGEITEQGAWEGEAPYWADEFSQIRLKILKAQERYEDYLNLAQAEGQTQAYLTMLGQLGRVEEAMTVAQEQMATLPEAKALAETLRAQGQLPQALEIAIQGLRLKYENTYLTSEFASWARDLAEGLGDRAAALEASIIGFKAKPSLKDYQTIEELSGEHWSSTKTKLLKQIRRMNLWQEADAQIDILLHEKMVDEAVQKVSGFSADSYHNPLILRVMDVVIVSHAQWVIERATVHADSIMTAGKSNYYGTAVEWLKRAKAAYLSLDQERDWLVYRRQLADTHGRKRKLMGLLQQNKL